LAKKTWKRSRAEEKKSLENSEIRVYDVEKTSERGDQKEGQEKWLELGVESQ